MHSCVLGNDKSGKFLHSVVREKVSRAEEAMFRHQSLSSNKYAPSNFRKEFAFRLSRCRAHDTTIVADSWISDIAGSANGR